MRILIVAATPFEIAPIVAALELRQEIDAHAKRYAHGHNEVDVLVSGVGMVATAVRCARTVVNSHYDLALNFGLCGSFDRALEIGQVVHVVSDSMPELGAEDGERFITIQDLKLLGRDETPYVNGRLTNRRPPENPALSALPSVSGITVNTVHGSEQSIANVSARFAPQVESMEGAAFAYVCLTQGLTFAQVRAVSNVVEKRNRAAWRIEAAIEALGRTARAILEHT